MNINLVKSKKILYAIFRYVIIFGISFYIVYPIILKLLFTFMNKDDIYDVTVKIVPRTFTLDNIKFVAEKMNYFTSLLNTLVFSLLIAVLQTVFCLFTGYGFARFDFKLKKFWFAIVILTLLVPPQVVIAPLYLKFRFFNPYGFLSAFLPKNGVNLIGTPLPFVISSVTCMGLRNGLFIYIIRQFFKGISKELEDAAHIDGAGHAKTYFLIMLPNAKPLAVTVMLFSFVWQYNDIFFSSWYMSGANFLSTNLNFLASNVLSQIIISSADLRLDNAYANLINATGSMLVIAPILIIYFVLQKQFTQSIERSGIVG